MATLLENISDIRRVEWVIKKIINFITPKRLLAIRGWRYYY
jgi:hypothetical protein